MDPSSRIKLAIGLLAFMLASAACALAQAEINPDHFPDPAEPPLTVKKTPPPASTKNVVKRSSVVTTQQAAAHREPAVHASAHPFVQASAANHERHVSTNPRHAAKHASDIKKMELISEGRRYAAP